MRGKKARELRKMVAGDPDMEGRVFARGVNYTTHLLHPQSYRKQYQQAKGLAKKGRG
jgi:hypothetical protein